MKKVWTLLGVVIILGLAVCEKPLQTGSIEVRSEPQGADVALDDSLTGKKTNCVLEDVPFGTHTLRLYLEGYIDWERDIEINEEQPDEDVYAGLSEAMAALQVNSHPEGAAIWLNGEETGFETNHLFTDLEPDTYTVMLTMEGYTDWETTVYVDGGDTAFVEADLDTSVNYPPEILGVTASPNPVEPGNQTTITCTATDVDGDALTYEWESVDEDTTYTGQSFIWTAPDTEGDYRFYVTVSDGQEEDYDSSLVVTVESGEIQPVTMLPPLHIGTSQATLIWTSAEPSWFEYRLFRSDTPDVPHYGQLIVTYSYPSHNRFDTTYTDTDLEPGRTYYYAVQVADSSDNTAWSNEISLTTESFEFLDSEPLGGGHGVRLVSTGNYIFCAAREQAVKSFTIESTGLGPAAQIPHPNDNVSAWAYDLVVSANLLHIAFGVEGYMCYDITNPMNPNDTLQVPMDTLIKEIRSVCAVGNNLYLGFTDPSTNTHGLAWCIVTGNPLEWTLVDFVDLVDAPTDIFVSGDFLYVTLGNAGLEIFAINDLWEYLEFMSLVSTNDAANRVYVSGSYAYVATESEGLVVFDVSSPSSPYYAGQWQDDVNGNDAQGLYFSGGTCYLADGVYGLRVLSMYDPLNPEEIFTIDLSEVVGESKLMDVVIRSQGMETQAILADWYDAVHMIRW